MAVGIGVAAGLGKAVGLAVAVGPVVAEGIDVNVGGRVEVGPGVRSPLPSPWPQAEAMVIRTAAATARLAEGPIRLYLMSIEGL